MSSATFNSGGTMNITFNIRYNLTLNLNLSTTNSQVMEMRNQDWSVSMGYTKTGMKLPI
jgi:hypothetical protein